MNDYSKPIIIEGYGGISGDAIGIAGWGGYVPWG